MAANIVQYRELTPFQTTTEISKVTGFQSIGTPMLGHFSVMSNTFRIVATGTSGDIKRIIESVMDISGSMRTVRYWREY
jgi:hypothetical protein